MIITGCWSTVKFPEDSLHAKMLKKKSNLNKKYLLYMNEPKLYSMCFIGLLLFFSESQLKVLLFGYFSSILCCCYYLASHFSIYFGPGYGISLHRKIPDSLYGKNYFKKFTFSISSVDFLLSKCKSHYLLFKALV